MHTEPHTKQLALPSSFNLPSSHHRDISPAHSPPPGSRPFSSVLRSSADTPLANYVLQRHRLRVVRPAYRETSHTVQVRVKGVFTLVPIINPFFLFSFFFLFLLLLLLPLFPDSPISSLSSQAKTGCCWRSLQLHHQNQVRSSAYYLQPAAGDSKRHPQCGATHRQVPAVQ